MRRVVLLLGVLIGLAGLVAAVAAVVQPWATYRLRTSPGAAGAISILDSPRGQWYLILLCVTFAAVVGVLGGRGRSTVVVALIGVLAGIVGTVIAATTADRLSEVVGERSFSTLLPIEFEWSAGPAIGPAIAAPLLFAVAAALLAVTRARPGE